MEQWLLLFLESRLIEIGTHDRSCNEALDDWVYETSVSNVFDSFEGAILNPYRLLFASYLFL